MVNEVMPDELGFHNDIFDKKKIKKVIAATYQILGKEKTAKLVDDFKALGFQYAGYSGITFAVSDIQVPAAKYEIIKAADEKLNQIEAQFHNGFLTDEERYTKAVELWMNVSSEIEEAMTKNFDADNNISYMVRSGARGNTSQLNQIAGMKGLVADPTGNIIELPIRSNFKEGLTVFEYFESTHGSRKGRADTALRTSEAGYLTRRLVDVSQDTVVSEHDCGILESREMVKEFYISRGKKWDEHLIGRVLAEATAGISANIPLTQEDIQKINNSGVTNVKIRSLMTCRADKGVCQLCYGLDPATGSLVEIGATVGIVAAQAIGEPGTQLTMRTFHTGGAAGEDITSGLPRVEELFEARTPKIPAIISEIDGTVTIVQGKGNVIMTVTGKGNKTESLILPANYKWLAQSGDKIKSKQIIAESEDSKPIRATVSGEIQIKDEKAVITGKGSLNCEYNISRSTPLKINDGDKVKQGDALTEGHFELANSMKLKGIIDTQNYIIDEVQNIYESQGQSINDKHIEVIVRQMCSKVKITVSYDEIKYLSGQVVDLYDLLYENKERVAAGEKPHQYENIIMGISRVALKTKSFLSAASFMETTSVLIDAAISGRVDELQGLKENIIIGKLIPAGTGYKGSPAQLSLTEK
jgi:DNA-directed RNA polymerase subunit beta'